MRLQSCFRTALLVNVLCVVLTCPAFAAVLARHSVLGAVIGENAAGSPGPPVLSIIDGSPAQRAQLQAGDIIVAIGDTHIADRTDVLNAVRLSPAGTPIAISIVRKGTNLSIPVVLQTAPDEDDPLVATEYGALRVDGSLRRTLTTYPRTPGASRHPAALIVGGIGCYTVDTARNLQDPYLRLAHDLGRRGIVAMRLEKSGVGDSQGPPCSTVDFLSEERSYEVALKALRNDRHVDARRVYVFGHSIGSAIAPRLAAKQPVAGIIVAEGVGIDWFEYELANLRRQLELGGEPPAKIDADLADKEICMHRLLVEKEDEVVIEKGKPDCKTHNTYPAPAAYLQEVAGLNLGDTWSKVSAPVLVIYGTADFVTARSDHERIAKIVNTSHAGAATFVPIEGMDHYLSPVGTLQQDYDLRVQKGGSAPYDARFSATILAWLCARERCLADTVGSNAQAR